MDSLSPERKTELLYFFVYHDGFIVDERERLLCQKAAWEKDLEKDLPETRRANYILAIKNADLKIQVIDLAIEYGKSLSAKIHRAIVNVCAIHHEKYYDDVDVETLSETEKKELDEINRLCKLHTNAQYDEGWAMMHKRLG